MPSLVMSILKGPSDKKINYDLYTKRDLELLLPPSNISPLHAAVASENMQCIEDLLQFGANPNVRDIRGNTPLHLASLFVDVLKVFELLLDYGANPNSLNKNGQHPLAMVIENKGHFNKYTKKRMGERTDIIKELLLRHIKFDLITNYNTLAKIADYAGMFGIGMGKHTTNALESSGKLKFK